MKDDQKSVLSHLSDGYRNAQDIIRALDVKANILTALSVFCFTAIFGILNVIWGHMCAHPGVIQALLSGPSALPLVISGLLGIAIAASLFLGTACLWCCISTLMARSPDPARSSLSATVLFPYVPPKGWGRQTKAHNEALKYYDRIRNGRFKAGDILPEYHNQITNVGAILGQKCLWNRRASNLFRWQVFSIPVVIVLVGLIKCT